MAGASIHNGRTEILENLRDLELFIEFHFISFNTIKFLASIKKFL